MSQKQNILVGLGVIGVGLLFVFVYQQFKLSGPTPEVMTMPQKIPVSEREQKAPVPETIDEISLSIQEETSMDLSALEDEENGEVGDIQADSESINNLSTSYDEQSL